MLVLNRNIGERVIMGDDIVVMVLYVYGNQVKLGFSAPNEMSIHREEIYHKIKRHQHTKAILPNLSVCA